MKNLNIKLCIILNKSSKDGIPFLSEKLDPDTFSKICAISNKEFNGFDKWEEYKRINLWIF